MKTTEEIISEEEKKEEGRQRNASERTAIKSRVAALSVTTIWAMGEIVQLANCPDLSIQPENFQRINILLGQLERDNWNAAGE